MPPKGPKPGSKKGGPNPGGPPKSVGPGVAEKIALLNAASKAQSHGTFDPKTAGIAEGTVGPHVKEFDAAGSPNKEFLSSAANKFGSQSLEEQHAKQKTGIIGQAVNIGAKGAEAAEAAGMMKNTGKEGSSEGPSKGTKGSSEGPSKGTKGKAGTGSKGSNTGTAPREPKPGTKKGKGTNPKGQGQGPAVPHGAKPETSPVEVKTKAEEAQKEKIVGETPTPEKVGKAPVSNWEMVQSAMKTHGIVGSINIARSAKSVANATSALEKIQAEKAKLDPNSPKDQEKLKKLNAQEAKHTETIATEGPKLEAAAKKQAATEGAVSTGTKGADPSGTKLPDTAGTKLPGADTKLPDASPERAAKLATMAARPKKKQKTNNEPDFNMEKLFALEPHKENGAPKPSSSSEPSPPKPNRNKTARTGETGVTKETGELKKQKKPSEHVQKQINALQDKQKSQALDTSNAQKLAKLQDTHARLSKQETNAEAAKPVKPADPVKTNNAQPKSRAERIKNLSAKRKANSLIFNAHKDNFASHLDKHPDYSTKTKELSDKNAEIEKLKADPTTDPEKLKTLTEESTKLESDLAAIQKTEKANFINTLRPTETSTNIRPQVFASEGVTKDAADAAVTKSGTDADASATKAAKDAANAESASRQISQPSQIYQPQSSPRRSPVKPQKYYEKRFNLSRQNLASQRTQALQNHNTASKKRTQERKTKKEGQKGQKEGQSQPTKSKGLFSKIGQMFRKTNKAKQKTQNEKTRREIEQNFTKQSKKLNEQEKLEKAVYEKNKKKYKKDKKRYEEEGNGPQKEFGGEPTKLELEKAVVSDPKAVVGDPTKTVVGDPKAFVGPNKEGFYGDQKYTSPKMSNNQLFYQHKERLESQLLSNRKGYSKLIRNSSDIENKINELYNKPNRSPKQTEKYNDLLAEKAYLLAEIDRIQKEEKADFIKTIRKETGIEDFTPKTKEEIDAEKIEANSGVPKTDTSGPNKTTEGNVSEQFKNMLGKKEQIVNNIIQEPPKPAKPTQLSKLTSNQYKNPEYVRIAKQQNKLNKRLLGLNETKPEEKLQINQIKEKQKTQREQLNIRKKTLNKHYADSAKGNTSVEKGAMGQIFRTNAEQTANPTSKSKFRNPTRSANQTIYQNQIEKNFRSNNVVDSQEANEKIKKLKEDRKQLINEEKYAFYKITPEERDRGEYGSKEKVDLAEKELEIELAKKDYNNKYKTKGANTVNYKSSLNSKIFYAKNDLHMYKTKLAENQAYKNLTPEEQYKINVANKEGIIYKKNEIDNTEFQKLSPEEQIKFTYDKKAKQLKEAITEYNSKHNIEENKEAFKKAFNAKQLQNAKRDKERKKNEEFANTYIKGKINEPMDPRNVEFVYNQYKNKYKKATLDEKIEALKNIEQNLPKDTYEKIDPKTGKKTIEHTEYMGVINKLNILEVQNKLEELQKLQRQRDGIQEPVPDKKVKHKKKSTKLVRELTEYNINRSQLSEEEYKIAKAKQNNLFESDRIQELRNKQNLRLTSEKEKESNPTNKKYKKTRLTSNEQKELNNYTLKQQQKTELESKLETQQKEKLISNITSKYLREKKEKEEKEEKDLNKLKDSDKKIFLSEKQSRLEEEEKLLQENKDRIKKNQDENNKIAAERFLPNNRDEYDKKIKLNAEEAKEYLYWEEMRIKDPDLYKLIDNTERKFKYEKPQRDKERENKNAKARYNSRYNPKEQAEQYKKHTKKAKKLENAQTKTDKFMDSFMTRPTNKPIDKKLLDEIIEYHDDKFGDDSDEVPREEKIKAVQMLIKNLEKNLNPEVKDSVEGKFYITNYNEILKKLQTENNN